MKLKIDDKGAAILQDGKPVYIHDDGKEIAFDAPATVATISRLNAEARSHRERAEQFEAKFKPFEALDVGEVTKAMETVKGLDFKKLVDAGEAEQARNQAIKAVEEKFKPYISKAERLEQQITSYMIGGGFKGSKYATEKLAAKGQAGADIAQALFGNRFKVEGEKVIGHDMSGNKLYSRARPGELADFDESLEMIVDAYPFKESILASTGATGGGSQQSVGGGTGGRKTMTRAQFDTASQSERSAFAKAGGSVTD